jgi:hypothetical protein
VAFPEFRQRPIGELIFHRFTLVMAAVKLIEVEAARPPRREQQLYGSYF